LRLLIIIGAIVLTQKTIDVFLYNFRC